MVGKKHSATRTPSGESAGVIKFSNDTLNALAPAARRYEVRDSEERGLRLRVTPNGVKTFGLFYRRADGALVRYTIGRYGDLTVKEARDEAKRIKGQAKNSSAADPATHKKELRKEGEITRRGATLGKLLRGEFKDHVTKGQRTGEETVQRIEANFPDLLDKPLTAITRWSLKVWAKDRKADGLSPSTIVRDLMALSAVFSFAKSAGLVATNPVRKPDDEQRDRLMPKQGAAQQVPRYLSPDEEKRLRVALADRDQTMREERLSANLWRKQRKRPALPVPTGYADHLTPMVLLVLNTGLRPGRELLELTWEAIDFHANTLTVSAATSKTGTARTIKLNAEAQAVLKEWKKITKPTGGLIFPNADGKPRDNFKKAWAGVTAAAGIKDCPPYSLRHTFATRLVMANVPLPVIQRLMGHQQITTTMRYVHVNEKDMESAVALLAG